MNENCYFFILLKIHVHTDWETPILQFCLLFEYGARSHLTINCTSSALPGLQPLALVFTDEEHIQNLRSGTFQLTNREQPVPVPHTRDGHVVQDVLSELVIYSSTEATATDASIYRSPAGPSGTQERVRTHRRVTHKTQQLH